MPLLALVACLLLAEPPAERCPDDCGLFGCDASGVCLTACEGGSDCLGSAVCDDDGVCVEPCDAADCPGGYGCDVVANACETSCTSDAGCRGGYHCTDGACLADCDDTSCAGGYACGFGGECEESCYGDFDCQEGYHCCDAVNNERGCDYGECVRD